MTLSVESRVKISKKVRAAIARDPEKARLQSIANLPKTVAMEKNPNWRGGKTKEASDFRIRNSGKFKAWRKKVLARDHHKCRDCGSSKRLEANHIIPLSETTSTAFLVSNGVTLCRACHQKTESWGAKKKISHRPVGKPIARLVSIPHSWQEYPTLGNYKTADDGSTVIFVSQMPDWRHEFLIALHEFIEEALTRHREIPEPDIMAFDQGLAGFTDDPGMLGTAPYHREHVIATGVEMLVATALDVKWADYEQTCASVSE